MKTISRLDSFIDRYMSVRRSDKNAKTLSADARALKAMLKFLGRRRHLDSIGPGEVEAMRASWKEAGVGIYEINRRIVSIKSALRRAQEWGLAPGRFFSNIRPFKFAGKRFDFYSPEEVAKLLSVADPAMACVIRLCYMAGLRRSEAFHLRWQDVDFVDRRIYVRARDGWAPKAGKERHVDMWPELEAYLRVLIGDSEQGPDCMVIFNRPPTPYALTESFAEFRAAAGITHGSLHSLRHGFGTRLAEAGVNMRWLQQQMGHSTIAMTERYAHRFPQQRPEALDALPSIAPA